MAKTATATKETVKAPDYLSLEEMASMKPIRATEKMPPEIEKMLSPSSGVFIRSKGKPTMDFTPELVNGSPGMWQIHSNHSKEELLTALPGLTPGEAVPRKAENGKRLAEAATAAYRPPWMEQEFLPKLVPFTLSRHETGIAETRTFLEPRAQEAQRLTYPWCTVGRTIVHVNGITWYGTGVLVGPNVVLTAGHNVPWGASNWSMEFVPAYREGDPVPAPFGSSYVETFRGYQPPNPFQANGYDYAICKLFQSYGQLLGTMAVRSFESESSYQQLRYTSSGYPKVFGGRPAVEFNLTIDDIDDDAPGKELETGTYASVGWSGGPLWYFAGTSPMIVGTVSAAEKDFVTEPWRDVHSGYRALVDLVQWGLDHWRP